MTTVSTKIPRWRRLLYALITLALICGLIEGLCFLLARRLPPAPPAYTSVETFLVDYGNRTRQPWFLDQDGPLPGVKGPRVVLRVAPETADARPFPGPGGKVRVLAPEQLPAGRRVLLLGASAAYGDGVKQRQTLAWQLQTLLRARRPAGDGAQLQVLNLARPAWELNSVAALAERLLEQLSARPAAVVLYTGNNEFSIPPIFQLQQRSPLSALASYRLVLHQARTRGWLKPPPGSDFHAFRNPRWEVFDAAAIRARLWHNSAGLPDMSYWTRVRKLQLTQFRTRLAQLVARVKAAGVPLVLVPPPVNLHFFPGGIYPQPVTYRAVGSKKYAALAARLDRALERSDLPALQALAREEPSGPLQRYYLGQQLDQAGKYRQAGRHLEAARDHTMGLLAALPSTAVACGELAAPGVAVVDSSDFYGGQRSVRERSRELFNDSCHPSAVGHRLLAQKVAAALVQLWDQQGAGNRE